MRMLSKMTLVDRFGQPWIPSENYQEVTPQLPGWLELECSGNRKTFSEVINLWGFIDGKRERFLVSTPIDEEPYVVKLV